MTTADIPAQGSLPAPPARRTGLSSVTDRAAFGLFLLMVLFAPVPDGSTAFVWLGVWGAVSALVLVLASYRDIGPGQLAVMAGLVAILLLYALIAWLQSTSPGPAPLALWARAADVLQMQIAAYSSSVVGAPLLFLGRPLLAACVLTAGMLFGADDRRARLVLRIFIYAAAVIGLIGLAAKLLAIDAMSPFDQGGALTTFFINKNTTATYLGSAFLAALAFLTTRIARRRAEGHSISASDAFSGMFALAVAGLIVLLLLPLTESRAGVVFTVLIAATVVLSRLRGRNLVLAGVVCVLLLAVAIALAGEGLFARQASTSFSGDPRWQAYAIMWHAIQERPWLGYGLGAFVETFTRFRDATLYTAAHFNIGHSTPLELAFEGGIPLMLAVVAFCVAVAGILLRGVIRRPFDPYILAALLVGLMGALHSAVDFSLQIPGYLIVCLAVVGIGLGRAFLPPEEMVRRRFRRQRRRPGDEGEETAA